ncbi:MAG: asparagine synthase C-terminal domain-containing protein [Gammaproteobacteria bacterium]|nr:asparagine synthase C-terminal domain-containing protein [Gammaproteobacteria bacterium]MBU2685581.1 asparagine synthase C-terminal domain-containing protein [Gammaproteobacteria bacterium]
MNQSPVQVGSSLAEAVSAAVGRALRESYGQVGIGLSGGLDSALLLKSILDAGARPVVFTIAGSPSHPDLLAALRLAHEWGVRHIAMLPSADDVMRAAEDIGKRPGPSNKGDDAFWLLAELMAASGITDVLATDGIDEQMGGYWEHRSGDQAVYDSILNELEPRHLTPLRASMARHGLWLHLPYLDDELRATIAGIPLAERSTREESKIPWRRLATSCGVPDWVLQREKVGGCDALS